MLISKYRHIHNFLKNVKQLEDDMAMSQASLFLSTSQILDTTFTHLIWFS